MCQHNFWKSIYKGVETLNLNKIVGKELANKAYNIISSEQISNEEEYEKKSIIIALCLKYDFKYQFINDFVFIYSLLDEWYFDYMNNVIKLFHKNKIYSREQYHIQKKFKTINSAIHYIKRHDKFCYEPGKNLYGNCRRKPKKRK